MLSCLSATSHDDELMIFDDDGHEHTWRIFMVGDFVGGEGAGGTF